MSGLLGERSAFAEEVYAAVRLIPEGHVATYGQIARVAGHPGAARAVGNALHINPDPERTPCFRVVNSKGKLAACFGFGGIYEHRRRLEEDGIEVINFKVDLGKYQWKE